MWRTLTIGSALLLIAFLVSAQESKPEPKASAGASISSVPVAEGRKENPVKPTAESLARAKKQYGYDCLMCHGKDGNGKGDVAVDMKLKMNDETNPSLLKDRTDGELFYIIKNGKEQMPPEGNRVKDETIWDMVNYVHSFAKKGESVEKPAEENKDAPSEKPVDEKPTN